MTHQEIINEYQKREIGCIKRDKWIKYCVELPTLKEAIIAAATARNKNNEKHSHQRRVKNEKLNKLAEKLLLRENEIKTIKDFDSLLDLITKTYVFDTDNELAYYDTAIRLGFRLNKLPRRIYLHAGTRTGIERLLRHETDNDFTLKFLLPEPFKNCDLTEYELEDLFCIYKDKL
jgi:hypothetical protein